MIVHHEPQLGLMEIEPLTEAFNLDDGGEGGKERKEGKERREYREGGSFYGAGR